MDLTPLLSPGDTTPMLPKVEGSGTINGRRHIRKIVQACFDQAMRRLKEDNFHEEADQLLSATVHWY